MKIKFSLRSIWHYIFGVIAVFACLVSPLLAIAITIAFIAYEWLQDLNIYRMKLVKGRDAVTDSHKDVYEFCVGLGVATIALIIMNLVGVL